MRAALAAMILLAGCAHGLGKQHASAAGDGGDDDDDDETFHCGDRHAEYAVTGTIVAPLAGVRMSCEGDRPTVEEYTAGDDDVEHGSRHVIDAAVWEESWQALERLGWQQVTDCADGAAARTALRGKGKKRPLYLIEVRDAQAQISVTCRGATLAFPYLEMREAIDRAARSGRGEGDGSER
jgi:hypothetical protein